jgi:hypothetical protein
MRRTFRLVCPERPCLDKEIEIQGFKPAVLERNKNTMANRSRMTLLYTLFFSLQVRRTLIAPATASAASTVVPTLVWMDPREQLLPMSD